ncbi:hypothetical protein EV361DRAFT_953089 [Lentinula raphanica]|nr:hypothetical protein EV361DRAFT_953089 [Lentinula raphanica]
MPQVITVTGNTFCIHPEPGSMVNIIVHPSFNGPLCFTFEFRHNQFIAVGMKRESTTSESAGHEELKKEKEMVNTASSNHAFPPAAQEFFNILDHGPGDEPASRLSSQSGSDTEDEDSDPSGNASQFLAHVAEINSRLC